MCRGRPCVRTATRSNSIPASPTGSRLAGLLKPALEIMWVEDVRRMNKFLDAEVPDVAGHLFGRERTALAVVRAPFKEAFGRHRFYCGTHLPANNPIDHVLPWSLRRAASIVVNRLVCRRGRDTRRSNDWTLASRRRGSAPKTVNTNPTQSCHAFAEGAMARTRSRRGHNRHPQ